MVWLHSAAKPYGTFIFMWVERQRSPSGALRTNKRMKLDKAPQTPLKKVATEKPPKHTSAGCLIARCGNDGFDAFVAIFIQFVELCVDLFFTLQARWLGYFWVAFFTTPLYFECRLDCASRYALYRCPLRTLLNRVMV